VHVHRVQCVADCKGLYANANMEQVKNENSTTSCSAIFHRIDAILCFLEPARKDLSNGVSHMRVSG
jgi:hypothetical protein